MQKIKLGDVCKFIDYRGKTPPKTESGIPLITAQIIKNGFIQEPKEFVPPEFYFENMLQRGVPKKGDVVFTTEAPLGEVAQIKTDEKLAFAQRVIIIQADEKNLHPNYLLYALQYEPFKKIIQGKSSGTTVFGIRAAELKEVQIEIPPLEEQKKIGATLGALDDKILLNKKINATLEAMAQTLYLHLFFRKAANGKFGDLIIENPKSTISVGDAKNSGGDFPFFTSGEAILNWKFAQIDGRNIFLNTGGNAGINFYVGAAAYSTDTWCITAENLADYLYLFLDTIKFEIGKKYFKGTALKHLQKDLLRDHEIYIPTPNELDAFNKKVQPSFDMICKNLRENYLLAEMRDFLLPLLMNGQITPKEYLQQ